MNFLNKRLFITVYLFAVATILGCSTPKALEYRDFKNFKIEKLGFASSYVKMEMVYFNPNRYGLQLKRTDLDIFINDVYLGHTAQEYQVTIPGQDTFSIPLQIEVDMKNLLKNGVNLLFLNEVTVKVTGSVKVGKANVFMGFPVYYTGKQVFTMF